MHVFHILIILLILNYSNNATELTQTTYTTPERPINVVVRKNRRDVVETQTQNEYCYQESVKLSCGKVKYYRVCKQVEVDPLKQIRRKLEPGENLIPSCILESSSSDVTTRYDCTSSALSFSSHNNFTGALVKANPFSGCIKLINRVNLNTESTYTVHYDKNDNSLGFRLSKKNQFDIIVSDLSVTAKRKGILSNDRLLKINSWCTKSHTFQEVAKKLKFADYPLTLTFESSDHHKNDHVDKFAVLMQRGGCDFDTKLRHAFEIGASALIVVDTKSDKNPVVMSTSAREDDESDLLMRSSITAVSVNSLMTKSLPSPSSDGIISKSIRLIFLSVVK